MVQRHPHLTGEALDEAIASAAHCKADGRHLMEIIEPPADSPRPTFGSLLVKRCERCGTLSYTNVNRYTGIILSRPYYDWPPWYKDVSSEERDRAWWRATFWAQYEDSAFLEAETNVRPIRGRRTG
jgi:hypothetical protein